MATRVTVVVPVYNPGRYLDACVASLRRQSLPPESMEVILVDDGSTDGSGRRLDRLAAEAANMRVIHTSNSGWPGRPRNIGLDAAHGDYVHFLDHDDWLGDEALERLLAMADRTGADVVLGREVGHGRGVPIELFRANADDARLDSDPLVRLMTPHKLFRRSMLVEHDIRFPEGRRRFEDHVFVLHAYFAARTISILADYPCYHWVTRADGKNASDEYADPRSYYADLRDVFDVVESNTEPGATRDRLIAHWYRRRCLDRLRGERWTDAPSAHDISAFRAVRDLARDRVGPGVDAILPLSHRLRSAAVRADRPDLVSALARVEHGLRARVRVQRLEREGRWLRLHVSADVVDAWGAPMRFARDGERLRWQPPTSEGAWSADQLDATADLESSAVSIVLLHEDGALQHAAPAVIDRLLRETPSGPVLSLVARAELDLGTVAAGQPLSAGGWELFADVESCGWHSRRRLPAVRVPGSTVPHHLAPGEGGGIGLVIGERRGSRSEGTKGVLRRRAGRHPLERLLPRPVLAVLPERLRRAGKRFLLRLDHQPGKG